MLRFALRLPDDLHGQLKTMAAQSQRSLHAEILWLLSEAANGDTGASGRMARLEKATAESRDRADRALGQVEALGQAIEALRAQSS